MTFLRTRRTGPDTSAHPNTGLQPAGQEDGSDADQQPGAKDGGQMSWLNRRTTGPGMAELGTRLTTKAFFVLILAGVICGPVALILASHTQPVVAPAVASSAAPQTNPADSLAAGSTATEVVRTWLSADQADLSNLAALVQVDVSQADLPEKTPTPPAWAQVDTVTRPDSNSGLWVVNVLAGGGAAGKEAAYRVLVRQDDTGFSALSLPARVGLPAPAGDLPDEDAGYTLDTTSTAAVTVAGFANALLTGSADSVSRWTSPGSSFPATGAVCRSTNLDALLGPETAPAPTPAGGDQVSVLATIRCTQGTRGAVAAMQYPLVLKARAGRWEVFAYAQTPPGTIPLTPTAAADPSTSTGPSSQPAADSGPPSPQATTHPPANPPASSTTASATPSGGR